MRICNFLQVAVFATLLIPVQNYAWTLETDIGADFQTYIEQTSPGSLEYPPESPVAIDAVGYNACYVATSYWVSGSLHSRILHWSASSGWSTVTNSFVSGSIDCLDYYGGALWVGGEFDRVGYTSTINAENVARLNPSSGYWQASAQGLAVDGHVYTIKATAWGGGSSGSRTYVYVGGQFTVSGTQCKNIARAYETQSGWVWDAMGGGVSLLAYTPVQDIEIAGQHSWDPYYGYRHKVYVGGNFSTVGSSVSANNLAAWTESSGAWSGFGSGLTSVFDDPFDNCNQLHETEAAAVASLGLSGSAVYLTGGFSSVNGTQWAAPSDPQTMCDTYLPIHLARVISSLGTWNNLQVYSYDYTYPWGGGILATPPSGGNIFLVFGHGAIIKSNGAVPAGNELPVGAYRIYGNGSNWEPIETGSTPGAPTPTSWWDVATDSDYAAFFIVKDSNGHSIRRYRYW